MARSECQRGHPVTAMGNTIVNNVKPPVAPQPQPRAPAAAAMRQADIDAFVDSAESNTLMPEGVTAAVAAKGIPVNGRHSRDGRPALHWAVFNHRRELVVALLAAGADANVKDCNGGTSVHQGAYSAPADILQLLIDGGGSVNELENDGCTRLFLVVR